MDGFSLLLRGESGCEGVCLRRKQGGWVPCFEGHLSMGLGE